MNEAGDAGGLGPVSNADFLRGGGEMGQRIRAHDWTGSSLGPAEQWPQSLKTAIRIMLTSRQPIWIGWGPELIFFYNDPYKSIIGGKHPAALGQPTAAVWREIWAEIGPMLATALGDDEGTYVEQQLLMMERNGYPEETYYTFSYSPIPTDDGSTGGIICANTDDTRRVLSERQLAILRDLAAGTADARTWQEVCERSALVLEANRQDLPFALIYMAEPRAEDVRLAGRSGIAAGHPAAPEQIASGTSGPWPITDILRKPDRHAVIDLPTAPGVAFPSGAWPQPPAQAMLIPIPAAGENGRAGVLIAGLNPFRLLDDGYRGFLTFIAGQIANSVANAHAYEEEKRRSEALAEIDRAKTTFFSNVSHEFRTPLTLMMGPLEDLLGAAGDEIPAESRTLVEVAHRNSTRLLKLVNSLLDFSRIEAGRVEASYKPTDLARLTAELASTFRSAIERAQLRLVIDCPALPEPVYVDHEMWEKIVLNLLSNALKFTFEGEISVAVRPSPDGRHADVVIADTGTGIAAEELPRLFERFRRIEGARGRSIEGTGIGLALVQELVKLHGGQVQVESEIGRGTAFTISIPLGTDHIPADRIGTARSLASTGVRTEAYVDEAMAWLSSGGAAPRETPAPAEEGLDAIAPVLGAERSLVLVTDDNADMRRYVKRLLRSAGYRVETAADGEEALEAIGRAKPDLILSDVMMPKLDGFGLLREVRRDPQLRDIPILLLSARAGEEAQVEGIRSGADDYLTKPFSARELLARVGASLRLAAIRRESARALEEQASTLAKLNAVGTAIAAELDLERTVQIVTDAATELSGAAFGSFFYNVVSEDGEAYTLYALSGVPREAFADFPMPRNTEVFGPTFRGEGLVRSDDITRDPRYGRNTPNKGMPDGHLPVRSYLAAPVVSQSGEVLGGLFFGHPEPGIFDERSEQLLAGIATQAAIAMDKARLYRAAQVEIERRTRTEAALRESERALETKVAERTAELTAANERLRAEAAERERAEEALRQAQKMESIGQLTGGVAHDFNNLLTVIIGNLETLQRHLRQPQQNIAILEHSTAQATRGAQRAASLTQRLLAFSRQQPLEPKSTDINRLIGGMSDLLRRSIGEQVAVETVLSGGLWLVHADPNQIEVAILNLAVNSRDAMPGGGKLTIETANAYLDEPYAVSHTEVAPGQYVVVAVTDNGLGMSRAVIARAFEPFFTTKDVGHGTGLGLSQVYGFVKQSGGHVKIYSEPGQGTTVKIYLPRFHSTEERAEPEAPARVPGAAHAETILVVEDDDDVRGHTTGILRELGYAVLEAPDGRAALKMIEEHPELSLLFTDVGLPGGMNGRQLAEAAGRIRGDLKVLFTTGYARNAIVHDGRLDPGVQLITKPFTYAAIATKLRDVLDLHAGTRRILVVEDEPLLQMLLVNNMEELGFKAETAGSATEALNKLRLMPGGFDGAIVDLGLPDYGGEVLVREMRALHPSLPVVISSGQGEGTMQDQFGAMGRVAILLKPYTNEELGSALQAAGIRTSPASPD